MKYWRSGLYNKGDDLSLFKFTDLSVNSYYIKRSVVPITLINIETRTEQLVYSSAAFNEIKEPELNQVNELLADGKYIVFGNSGPKRKTEYGLLEDNDADLIIFSDEKSSAYYTVNGTRATTYVLVDDKCNIYLEE